MQRVVATVVAVAAVVAATLAAAAATLAVAEGEPCCMLPLAVCAGCQGCGASCGQAWDLLWTGWVQEATMMHVWWWPLLCRQSVVACSLSSSHLREDVESPVSGLQSSGVAFNGVGQL